MKESAAYAGWARVELMGHRVRIGKVQEVQMYGGAMLRIDIPTTDGQEVTEFYGASSIYALSPISEQVGKDYATKYGWGVDRPVKQLDYRPAGEDEGGQRDRHEEEQF